MSVNKPGAIDGKIYFESQSSCHNKAYQIEKFGKEEILKALGEMKQEMEEVKQELADKADDFLSKSDRRHLERQLWYYCGILSDKYCWKKLEDAYAQYKQLDIVPTGYLHPSFYQAHQVPKFEMQLAAMLKTAF